ncbi:hypothetical protein [Inquilinus sp. OTU3971]|uniref:hypothetical protein n=1 Tax=Inquilinus sp. OTU3971 TaxID=3043855 RepID=UPI00313B4578
MTSLIRLVVFAGAVLAIAPVASAQCVVDPNAVGTPCVGGRTGGSPPLVRGQRPVVQDLKPVQKVAPIKPIPAPQPAKPGNLSPPSLSPPPALKP